MLERHICVTQFIYRIFLPNLIIAMVYLLPCVQGAVLDIGTELVNILH